MHISDWSADVCPSDLTNGKNGRLFRRQTSPGHVLAIFGPALEKALQLFQCHAYTTLTGAVAQLGERIVRNDEVRGSIPLGSTTPIRSEEHTSELQSIMRISYADFWLKHKKTT